MSKALLWIIGILIGVPAAIVAFLAFLLFVFYPLQHSWNVYRMDAKNDRVWQEGIARVVTVEADLGGGKDIKTLTAQVVCYEGYFAKPFRLKSGAPRTRQGPRSVGFETLQGKFPTGATVDINLRFLCNRVFSTQDIELPLKFKHNEAAIVAPELSLYCRFRNKGTTSPYAIHTDAGWVGHAYITAIEKRDLSSLTTRSEMGSSETPSITSGFTRRWPWAFGSHSSGWKAKDACWTGRAGVCNEALTNFCGKNPK
ncbi:MAG: hypothetical protein ABJH45_00205 [Paracoccaceae bacterium]